MLTAIPLSEIERVVRRTALTAIAIGLVASIVAYVMGAHTFPVGMALGLFLAICNHRVFQSSAMRFTSDEGKINRKPFAGSVFLRLGVCTLVAIGLLIIDQPVGWGVMSGLALFQATMLGSAIVSLIRFQKQGFTDEVIQDA